MKVESVSFNVAGKVLYGNLHLPGNKTPPCIVLLHGLESSKGRGKWPFLAYKFGKGGFACLRFSFRGCGEGTEKSDGVFEDTSLTDRIEDYEAALRFLEEIDKVDMERLGVLGSSFGGMVAIASENNKIKAMITLATPYKLSEFLTPQKKEGDYILPSGKKLKEKFFLDLKQHDLLEAIRKAPPILMVHGSEDGLVPVEHAHRLYAAAKKPKKLEIVEGANHRFSQPKDLAKIIDLCLIWFRKYL